MYEAAILAPEPHVPIKVSPKDFIDRFKALVEQCQFESSMWIKPAIETFLRDNMSMENDDLFTEMANKLLVAVLNVKSSSSGMLRFTEDWSLKRNYAYLCLFLPPSDLEHFLVEVRLIGVDEACLF